MTEKSREYDFDFLNRLSEPLPPLIHYSYNLPMKNCLIFYSPIPASTRIW